MHVKQVVRVLCGLGMLTAASLNTMAATVGNGMIDRAMSVETEADGKAFLAGLSESDEPDVALAKGICYHNLSRVRPETYLKPALQTMEKIAKASALAQAYLGSLQTILGGEAVKKGDVVGATAGVEQGFKNIDEALSREPDNVIIRMLRLANGLEVAKASPFQRYDILKQDVEFLTGRMAGFPADFQAEVWYQAGQLSLGTKKVNEALDRFDRSVRAAPASRFGKLARKSLADLEE